MQQHNQGLRSKCGSAISEMPPALFMLFFVIVYPLINLIFLGVVYASCVSLNTTELREAARTPRSQLTAALGSLQEEWRSNILGRMVGVTKIPESKVSYSNLGDDTYVIVSTTFNLKPILSLPLFNKVPALGAPWSFSLSSKRVLENPNYAYM